MDWLDREFIASGKLPLLLCFVAYITTFIVTRTITRLIRAGKGPFKNNISKSGVHVHHAVPGIIILIAGAFTSLGAHHVAVRSIAGVAVGTGTALVLDEFALILRLQDVYWSAQGRLSVEMVSLACAVLGLALVGAVPFGVDGVGDLEFGTRIGTAAALMLTVAAVVICALKGKERLALLGAFLPPLAVIGAIRLARPKSRWARRYDAHRVQKATERTVRFDKRWGPLAKRFEEIVAGEPMSLPG